MVVRDPAVVYAIVGLLAGAVILALLFAHPWSADVDDAPMGGDLLGEDERQTSSTPATDGRVADQAEPQVVMPADDESRRPRGTV